MGVMLDTIGQLIAGYLQKEVPGYEPFTPSDPEHLRGVIEPGDVLLVEGNNRISGIIKYLTQSTWSHGALYVGPVDGAYEPDGEPHVLIEANIGEGVTSAPLSKYFPYHTRVCRPIGLSYEDRTTVCRYAINRIGFGYDTKNIVDLMRYLIPLPVPQRWRRRMIAFGSGDPTKIICSALIAQAFDAVRYPILPKITRAASRKARREILHIRDSSLYMPRDFDISPYFEIVKPTIVHGFDYTALHWADKQKPLQEVAGEFGVFPEIESPSLVPEEIDQEAPLPVATEEVTVRNEDGRARDRVGTFPRRRICRGPPAGAPRPSAQQVARSWWRSRTADRRVGKAKRAQPLKPTIRIDGGHGASAFAADLQSEPPRQRQPHRQRLRGMNMTVGNTVDRLARQPRQIVIFDLVGFALKRLSTSSCSRRPLSKR